MAYEKIGFNKGDVLKAEHLNHIEEGIKNNSMSNLGFAVQMSLDSAFATSGVQSFKFVCNTPEVLEEIKKFPLGLTLNSHLTDNNWYGQLRHIGLGRFIGILTYDTKGSSFVILNLQPSTFSLTPDPYDQSRLYFTVQGTISKYSFRTSPLSVNSSDEFKLPIQLFYQMFGSGIEIETIESDEILNFYAFDFNNSYDAEFLNYLYLFEVSASGILSEHSFLKPYLNGKILYTYQITNTDEGITLQKIKQHIQGDVFFPIEITDPQFFEMLSMFYLISESFSLKGNIYVLFNGKYTLMAPISREIWYVNLSEFDFNDLSYLNGILKIDIPNQTINAYIIDSANNALIPLALESILT